MTENEKKKLGQWMTPDDIAKQMIDFAPQEWYKGNVLEPCAGNGQLVIQILERKLNLGMTPQEAIDTTFMNEIDTNLYNMLIDRIYEWCSEHNCNISLNNIKNDDARTINFEEWCGDYKVICNIPYGSWANSNLPRQIINKLNKPAVYLTKWTTGCYNKYVPHVKKFENVVFPGIVFDTLLWEYDPEYTEGDIWIYWPLPKLPKHKLKKNWKEVLEQLKEKNNDVCGSV